MQQMLDQGRHFEILQFPSLKVFLETDYWMHVDKGQLENIKETNKGTNLGQKTILCQLIIAISMSFGYHPFIRPKYIPFSPVYSLVIRSFTKFPVTHQKFKQKHKHHKTKKRGNTKCNCINTPSSQ